jgi:hypothetical protein
MHATWGHLEQKPGTTTKGWFVFTCAAYSGNYMLLDSDWGDLPDSPGLYDAMQNYMHRHAERGVVTRLEGHVTRYANGAYRIGGKRYVVRLKPPKRPRAPKK